MQCELTKRSSFPKEAKDATTAAKTIVEKFILQYGLFKKLKSDKGTEFKNELLSEVCKLLKIEQIFSTPYHHETLGSIERNHRVLREFLLNFCNDDNWDYWIPYYCFAYNTTPHIDTGYTPYELIFGKFPSLPNISINDEKPIYNLDKYVTELKHRLQFSLNKAKKYLDTSKQKRVENSTKNIAISNFSINDLVLVKRINRKKYQSPYHGPYKIISKDGVNSTIFINGKEKTLHNNLLKKYTNN